MNQEERRVYLIQYLLNEDSKYEDISIPNNEFDQKKLLRALMNVRIPKSISNQFITVQDAYLKEEINKKGIVSIDNLDEIQKDLYIWQGDITTLKCDAIVNAANSQMLGCFCPNHGCIDNAIHTYAGVQLRLKMHEIMSSQQTLEETGRAKITPAYNLPFQYILHTVGPIVRGVVTNKDKSDLKNCYTSCLELAEKNGLKSIAFCCISTGEFHFPNDLAAQIAIETVKEYKRKTSSEMKVIFNVFKSLDKQIYTDLLG